MDFCFETLGTNKHKQSLNSRRINKFDSKSLSLPAPKDKESITNTGGLNVLINDDGHGD